MPAGAGRVAVRVPPPQAGQEAEQRLRDTLCQRRGTWGPFQSCRGVRGVWRPEITLAESTGCVRDDAGCVSAVAVVNYGSFIRALSQKLL